VRVFNFAAGPATLPLEVLEQAREELTDWRGCGMSVTGCLISSCSTVAPRMTPDRIRNNPTARSSARSNRTRTGPTNE